MKTNEIANTVITRVSSVTLAAEQKLAAIKLVQERMQERSCAFLAALPALETVLSNLGLEINSVGCYKTGMDADVWKDGDKLKVDFTAVPTSGKFKFLAFQGYTARGAGKNEERLHAKAAAIEEAIRVGAGFTSVDVNSCSLEVRDDKRDGKGRVMVSLFV